MEVALARESRSQPFVGIIVTILTALCIVRVVSFAAACPDEDMSCTYAARAVLGVAAVCIILAIVRIFERDEGERRALSLSCALLGFLMAALPSCIIDLCGDSAMPCHTHLQPFVLCIGIAIGLTGAIDLTRRLLALR